MRGSSDKIEELLDPDFEEIGKSGHLWKRGEMIAPLVAENRAEQHNINVSEMNSKTVGPGLVLLTYITPPTSKDNEYAAVRCGAIQ